MIKEKRKKIKNTKTRKETPTPQSDGVERDNRKRKKYPNKEMK